MPPSCPSCGTLLARMPQRKTKCPHCGEAMCARRTPESPEKRLMTLAQAEANEKRWSEYSNRSAEPEDAKLVSRGLLGDRDAVLELIGRAARAGDHEAHERWLLLLIELDLAILAERGIQSAQLVAGRSRDRLCPVCRALDQSIISVHAGARAVVSKDCTCQQKGLLMVSGWIKRQDGTGCVDMERCA